MVGKGSQHLDCISGSAHDRRPITHRLKQGTMADQLHASAPPFQRSSSQLVDREDSEPGQDPETKEREGGSASHQRRSKAGGDPEANRHPFEICLGQRTLGCLDAKRTPERTPQPAPHGRDLTSGRRDERNQAKAGAGEGDREQSGG
jgi:hypothetical protein